MATHNQISNTIWNVANHLRGSWKNYEYQDVILPLTVLKRLDAALEPTKQQALERFNELDGKVSDLRIIRRVTGYDFYNISPFTFKKLLDDQTHVARNLRKYIDGFSDNVKEIFSKFDFEKQLDRLEGSNILYLILQEFDKIELHPDKVPNHEIGLAFEDLIRRFAEQSNETAGEHYTPRDVVRLMTGLIFTGEEKELSKPGIVKLLFDPACGTGGMLTVGKDYILSHFNKDAQIHLFGQELNSATYAICKADMLLKGENIEHIKGGEREHDKASTLSNDQHNDKKFDYIISNPPYGVEWKKDEIAVKNEASRGSSGRFCAGLPRISDGQLLFLQHAISKFKPLEEGGSDAAVIFNGSPLFVGDAGSGESEIRRWVLENDYLDAIVALPEKLFFNTGISTYIWLLTNRKSVDRKGKVILIDARNTHTQLRKNLGEKRYEISEDNAKGIIDLYNEYSENEKAKIFPTTAFAYREITIQNPLRLRFEITSEKRDQLHTTLNLDLDHAKERVRDTRKQEVEVSGTLLGLMGKNIRKSSETNKLIVEGFRKSIQELMGKTWLDREKFVLELQSTFKKHTNGVIGKAMLKTIISIVGDRDEKAEICLSENGLPEADNELKDSERVPWGTDIHEHFDKEIKPYSPNSWIDESVRDEKDGQVGIVGYEIPFTRYFYKYKEPRRVEKIEEEIKATEAELQKLLRGLGI